MSYYLKSFILLSLITLLTSCIPEPEVDTDPIYTCQYSGTLHYDIGVDITSDFDENNVQVTNTVSSSSCTNVSAGSINSESIDNVRRVSTSLTFTHNGSSRGLTITGTSFNSPASETIYVNNDKVSISYSNSRLDTGDDSLLIDYDATITKSGFNFAQEDSKNQLNTFFLKIIQ
ncbi:MAG: hypothetical protein N4A33_00710 [Bacteriovoracaceae bacterium]|jgi:hypothetical protein|nr:hypothetical protein [Bacteriovoracaceae bacterium]